MRSIDVESLATASRPVVAALALVASLATIASAQSSGIQQTPDSARYLINKDLQGQRWAISFNLNDRTVTGNVFNADGSPPQFVWCKITRETPAPNPAQTQYLLDCYGAVACAAAPCADTAWNLIATGIPIGGDFLLPDNTKATLSGNVQPIFTQSCATNLACHVAGGAGPVNLADKAAWAATFEVRSSQDANRFYVMPFDPGVSYLFNKIEGTGVGSRMPLGAPPLTAEQIDAIRNWIVEGAANN